MPLYIRALSLTALAAVFTASAPADTFQRVWNPYVGQLARQCPAKHLELLAPAELRDALDDYKQRLPKATRIAMDRSETRHCLHVTAGASCSNIGDIEVGESRGLLPSLATSVCNHFATCREQSDCDPVAAGVAERQADGRPLRDVVASMSEAAWDAALGLAAAGNADRLDRIASLRSVTDGSRSESIEKALSDALLTNPRDVLKLMQTHSDLPGVARLCEDRSIEPTKSEVANHNHAALAAVKKVKDSNLTALRDQCIASLRQHSASSS